VNRTYEEFIIVRVGWTGVSISSLMTRAVFVPTATPVESVEYLPDAPPETSSPGIPPCERERGPKVGPFRRCNLRLRQGCYQLFLTSTDAVSLFSKRLEGTMRVEIDPEHTTISGDLYRGSAFDDLVNQGVAARSLAPRPFIPIKQRSRYFSYLRVIDIQTSPVLAPLARVIGPPIFDLCSITLTVEEFRFTHPSVGQATGSFPSSPDRTLGFVLRKANVPSGFEAPAFEGDVFENGKRLPLKVSLQWVSEFFRRARLELESVTGVPIPPSVGGNGFQSTYAKAGWDLRVVIGNTNIALPRGVAPTWTEAELHDFMLANRNPATNLDTEWQMYHVSVPLKFADRGLFGLMFDQIGEEREGACTLMDSFTGVDDDDRARLRTAIHEIGHGFNQVHPPDDGLPIDNSVMTTTPDLRQLIEDSGGTYPDDINFTFSAHDRHHLIHAPDVVVRPGGEDFGFGHGSSFSPEAQDHAKAKGVELRVGSADERLKLGQPLVLRAELVNGGTQPLSLPAAFSTALNNVSVVVKRAGSEERRLRSFILVCDDARPREQLAPGRSISFEEVVFWDRNGVVFQHPGPYSVSIEARWFDGDQPFAAEASTAVWVDYPVSEKENAIAAALFDDEVGKYVALGGNAVHLKRAVARIEQARKLAANNPAVHRIATIDKAARDRKKRFKAKRPQK